MRKVKQVLSASSKFLQMVTSPVMRTDQIGRYSGVRQAEPESLAAHITDVQMMGYFLILKLNNEYGEDIDIGSFLEKALIHDIDEVLTGDVPRSTKYFNNDILRSMKNVACEAMTQMSNDCFQSDRVYKVWEESKSGKDGTIVKIADMLSVARKAMIEIEMLNNNYFLKVAYEVRAYLKEIADSLRVSSPYNPAATEYLISVILEAHDEIDRIWNSRKEIAERYGLLQNVFVPKK